MLSQLQKDLLPLWIKARISHCISQMTLPAYVQM